jgi:pilus assembly protein FimV
MGESEERLEYSPEEEKELDRILKILPEESVIESELKTAISPQPVEVEEEMIAPIEEISEMPEEGLDEFEEVEDITGLIEEVEEPAEEALDELVSPLDEFDMEETLDIERPPDLEEVSEGVDITEEEEFPELGDISEVGLEPAEEFDVGLELPEEEIAPPEIAPEKEPRSALDELEDLTSGEPASVDFQDISDDRFVGGIEEPEEFPGLEEIEEMPESVDLVEEKPLDISIGEEAEPDIPDLSDISLEAAEEIPEARDEDIPEVDLGGVYDIDEAEEEIPGIDTGIPSMGEDDFAEEIPSALKGLDEIEGIEEVVEEEGAAFEEEPLDEFKEVEPMGIPSIDEIDDIRPSEGLLESEEVEIDTEEIGMVEKPVEAEETIELSDKELSRLKKAIILFHPNLRKVIRETILNDLLPASDMRQLVDMILTGKPEANVHRFLEKKLARTIDITEERGVPGRRVITARPEYTSEGRERQQRLLRLSKVFGIAAVVAFIATILSYQFIYKPIMAKRYIMEGVAIIREPGDPVVKKVKDYKKAEEIFSYVEENYAKKYLYGYNAYGRAYFDKREYDLAFKKLTEAYEINRTHLDTLNNLGYFFSRVPENYFRRIEGRIRELFYRETKLPAEKSSQLDIAIDLYKRVLTLKPDNITALFGIGNAYMYQGQFFKARQYYENILKVDKDSVVGYSGLLNLFIERDNFPEVLTVHSDLRYRDMLPEVPSSLLAKLAAYYLGKKKTDSRNIRVDYGVQSSKIKDLSDNPYPAVRSVLDALMERDPDYPPLYLHHARLARAEDNLKLMEEYLKTAIKKEPNYFGALHLLGEYHYMVKEPVEAYRFFNSALIAHRSPPEFTNDDFYYESENIGKTYAMIGNIFYYFFDKVKYRYGDELEDEEVSQEIEKLANYRIAREKYELAIKEGYRSRELFYNLGRIYYMKGLYEDYEKAIENWLNLYEDFAGRPELMYALGNAFYHLHNLEASKGEYLKLISIFEHDAEMIAKVVPSKLEHIRIFQTLSLTYNNLGAVYQRQDNEVKSSISYWKAIDYAKRIERENEFARVNLARSFKVRKESIMPIIDENIPFSIQDYREE